MKSLTTGSTRQTKPTSLCSARRSLLVIYAGYYVLLFEVAGASLVAFAELTVDVCHNSMCIARVQHPCKRHIAKVLCAILYSSWCSGAYRSAWCGCIFAVASDYPNNRIGLDNR